MNFEDEGIIAIAGSLIINTTLQSLYITINCRNYKKKNAYNYYKVKVSVNLIADGTGKAARMLIEGLKTNVSLTSLNLACDKKNEDRKQQEKKSLMNRFQP